MPIFRRWQQRDYKTETTSYPYSNCASACAAKAEERRQNYGGVEIIVILSTEVVTGVNGKIRMGQTQSQISCRRL